MKLLFDQNISPRLSMQLADLFPDSAHVREVGLEAASDREVWEYAREHGFVIVSKDSDFRQISFLLGPPPKVVWVALGNCSTDEIERHLRASVEQIMAFGADPRTSFLVLAEGAA